MANFKRRRPKHQRAGCLVCKPQKDERGGKEPRDPPSVQRQLQDPVPGPIEAKMQIQEDALLTDIENTIDQDQSLEGMEDWLDYQSQLHNQSFPEPDDDYIEDLFPDTPDDDYDPYED